MSTPEIEVHSDPAALAAAVAEQLVGALVEAQRQRGSASVVLTGGGTGIAVLEQVRTSPARDTLDWSRLDVFWGDERFLPAGHSDRNETQARAALLDHVALDPARVHAVEPSDGRFGDDPDAVAADYARVLAEHGAVIDVLLLGMGGEGHVLSVFPDSPAVHEVTRSVVAVRDCPKPPPTRVSLTLATVRAAAQVWVCVAGEGKAEAVARALGGADEVDLPAAGARGAERTLFALDRDAAGALA